MQFEVTPRLPPSSATTFDSPSRPCFAATYAALYGDARSPCTDEMLMIRPQPCAYICGSACRTSRNGASSITRRIRENASGGNSSTAATCCRPALLTRMSTAASAISPTPSASRSTRTTRAPAAANRCAQARPIPLAAPVTSAVRPERSMAVSRRGLLRTLAMARNLWGGSARSHGAGRHSDRAVHVSPRHTGDAAVRGTEPWRASGVWAAYPLLLARHDDPEHQVHHELWPGQQAGQQEDQP